MFQISTQSSLVIKYIMIKYGGKNQKSLGLANTGKTRKELIIRIQEMKRMLYQCWVKK